MTWTVTKEHPEYGTLEPHQHSFAAKLHIRAIIDIDNEQAELKDLIASLQKHVKSDEPA